MSDEQEPIELNLIDLLVVVEVLTIRVKTEDSVLSFSDYMSMRKKKKKKETKRRKSEKRKWGFHFRDSHSGQRVPTSFCALSIETHTMGGQIQPTTTTTTMYNVQRVSSSDLRNIRFSCSPMDVWRYSTEARVSDDPLVRGQDHRGRREVFGLGVVP